jgi:uncharacterized membrane protein (UPF0127 family)
MIMLPTICGVTIINYARRNCVFRSMAAAALVLLFVALPAAALDRAKVEIEAGSARHLFLVEVARSDAERERGLMERTSLPLNTGMFFVFDREELVNMWMKNTFVSLDMIFADTEGRIVSIASDTEPMSLRIISSGVPAKSVLEVRAGTARRLGIRVGDRLSLKP